MIRPRVLLCLALAPVLLSGCSLFTLRMEPPKAAPTQLSDMTTPHQLFLGGAPTPENFASLEHLTDIRTNSVTKATIAIDRPVVFAVVCDVSGPFRVGGRDKTPAQVTFIEGNSCTRQPQTSVVHTVSPTAPGTKDEEVSVMAGDGQNLVVSVYAVKK